MFDPLASSHADVRASLKCFTSRTADHILLIISQRRGFGYDFVYCDHVGNGTAGESLRSPSIEVSATMRIDVPGGHRACGSDTVTFQSVGDGGRRYSSESRSPLNERRGYQAKKTSWISLERFQYHCGRHSRLRVPNSPLDTATSTSEKAQGASSLRRSGRCPAGADTGCACRRRTQLHGVPESWK